MQKSKKKSKNSLDDEHPQQSICYEGDRLVHLIKSLEREIESAKSLNGSLPNKIWFKQQFAIGVNDVTRVLERMTPSSQFGNSSRVSDCGGCKPSHQLQVVLVASDCNPRWLTKHLPSLALSRNVPLISIKDNKAGSLRLGELVGLRTAIAVGVKVKGNGINKLIEEILRDNHKC